MQLKAKIRPRYWKSHGKTFLNGHSNKARNGMQSSHAIRSPSG